MAILLCVWILALLYMGFYLKRGWVPHDEGTYAQSAERFLNGELPHRDFDEGYTGGLTLLNAVAFRTFGVNLASPRIFLFGAFALWVPCVFYVASRFVSVIAAGAITLLCVAWSVPNYPAASPSWYNLFFTVFGVGALLRLIEVGSRRWLFLAGLCGGFSILAKITGLYFVAAVLLFLIFREQNLTEKGTKSGEKSWLFRAFVTIGLILFLWFLARLVLNRPGLDGLVYFVAPSAVLVVLLLYREFGKLHTANRRRFLNLFSMFAPFAAGVAAPILIFLIPYVISHSTRILLYDALDLSTRQVSFAATSPSTLSMIAILPIFVLIIAICFSHRQGQRVYGAFLVLYLAAILAFSSGTQLAFVNAWCSLAYAIPAITIGSALLIGVGPLVRRLARSRQEQIMLVTATMAVVSLVQFPFSAPIYFCYIAPLAILSGTALLASLERVPKFALQSLIAFYLLFAAFLLTPRFVLGPSSGAKVIKKQRLTLARAGGLRVDRSEAELYEKLIPLIKSHATGQFIYAAPDCPEVYFLAGLRNPTRIFFDYRDNPIGRKARILQTLESHGVSVVALDRQAQFFGPLEPDLTEALKKLYPVSEEIGHFEVRWKVNSFARNN